MVASGAVSSDTMLAINVNIKIKTYQSDNIVNNSNCSINQKPYQTFGCFVKSTETYQLIRRTAFSLVSADHQLLNSLGRTCDLSGVKG